MVRQTVPYCNRETGFTGPAPPGLDCASNRRCVTRGRRFPPGASRIGSTEQALTALCQRLLDLRETGA